MTPQQFDEWRVIPRLLMIAYYAFFAHAFYYVSSWFMAYDWGAVHEPTIALAIAAFPTAVLAVLTNVLASLTKLYMTTGRYAQQTLMQISAPSES